MLRNSKHVYGVKNVLLPANLNLGDFLLHRMLSYGDNVAMINGATDEKLTFRKIVQDSMNLAISLSNMGVRKGDTVALFSENRLEFWGAVIGSVCAGAVLTTISTGYVRAELIHVMNISKPKYIICSQTTYKNFEKTLRSLNFLKKIIVFGTERFSNAVPYNDLVSEENGKVRNVRYEEFEAVEVQGQTDAAFVMYSSGTTGLPKGVMNTHLNVLTACTLVPLQDPKNLTLTASPWYHVMGLVGVLCALAVGRCGIYLPKFDVDTYLKTIEKYKVVQLSVVPPILVAVCKEPSNYDLSSVRMIFSGAAPLMKETIEATLEKFPNVSSVYQGYGSTELTLAAIRYSHGDVNQNKPGSVGRVVANMVVKVVDVKTREPLGPNQPGELCIKGDLLMKGYIGRDPREDLDAEGFYKTGDIGYYDEDGFFYIVDRLKELIKYKGFQVPPAELEAVLLQHEAIKDAAVIGMPHKDAGEVPLAFVVPQPGRVLSEKNVKNFVAERLSNPKHLRGGVIFVEQIPKSASGKILRKDLKRLVKSKSKL